MRRSASRRTRRNRRRSSRMRRPASRRTRRRTRRTRRSTRQRGGHGHGFELEEPPPRKLSVMGKVRKKLTPDAGRRTLTWPEEKLANLLREGPGWNKNLPISVMQANRQAKCNHKWEASSSSYGPFSVTTCSRCHMEKEK
jgi:hypothetical protein